MKRLILAVIIGALTLSAQRTQPAGTILSGHPVFGQPGDGQAPVYNTATKRFEYQTTGGSSSTDTASNTGSLGVGLFKTKAAGDFQFYKASSANNLLTIALSGTDFVQFTINQANFSFTQSQVTNLISDLAGKAATSHAHAAADTTSGTFDNARIPTPGPAARGGVYSGTCVSPTQKLMGHTTAGALICEADAGGSTALEFEPSQATNTVTFGSCSSGTPCRYSWDDVLIPLTASPTFTWLSGAAGTLYVWLDSVGCKYGTTTGLAFTVSNCTTAGTVTDYPTTQHKRLGRVLVSSSAVASFSNDRSFIEGQTKDTPGTGLQRSGSTLNVVGLTPTEFASGSRQANGAKVTTTDTLTTGAIVADSNGKLSNATGTATDCVKVNGSSGSCGGSTPVTTDNWFVPAGWPVTSTASVSATSVANGTRFVTRAMPHTQVAYRLVTEITAASVTAGAVCYGVIWDRTGATMMAQTASFTADSTGNKEAAFPVPITLSDSVSYRFGITCTHADATFRGVTGSAQWGFLPAGGTVTPTTMNMGTATGALSGTTAQAIDSTDTASNNISFPLFGIYNN